MANDWLELLFQREVRGKSDDGSVTPLYISLSIHDKILHNVMLDSGASQNIMPRAITEKLGLDITRNYKIYIHFIQVKSDA